MAVRTKVLGRAVSGAGGGTIVLGTVPANQTWIAKYITILNVSGASDFVQLQFLSAVGAIAEQMVFESVSTNGLLLRQVEVVGMPGDILRFICAQAGIHVSVSGAALSGVAS